MVPDVPEPQEPEEPEILSFTYTGEEWQGICPTPPLGWQFLWSVFPSPSGEPLWLF